MISVHVDEIDLNESKKFKIKRCNLIDTSYRGAENSTGKLRFPKIYNGNYKIREPIFDELDNRVGSIRFGSETIGYTYSATLSPN